MKDMLGDRMKGFYENVTKYFLPRRTYTIIRIDGKAFHSYTKGCVRPFDEALVNDMDETAKYLCENVQGCKLAFVQSDEISLVLTDFDKLNTSSFFGGSVQKIASVTASMATAKFNQFRIVREIANRDYKSYDESDTYLSCTHNMASLQREIEESVENIKLAEFDSRVFTIPHISEVYNYLIWRQQDTTRNSIQSVAQSLYSHKELHGKKTDDLQELIFQKGINWNDYDPKLKRGRLIIKTEIEGSERKKWSSVAPNIFTQDKSQLMDVLDCIGE